MVRLGPGRSSAVGSSRACRVREVGDGRVAGPAGLAWLARSRAGLGEGKGEGRGVGPAGTRGGALGFGLFSIFHFLFYFLIQILFKF